MSKLAREARPWTRWWWMGSALNEAEITRCLTEFRDAGFGGVEVSPIYGPRGFEKRFVPFLSQRWRELFAHTVKEANRLDLGVDLIAGTGWPFGGPQVSAQNAARRYRVERFDTDDTLRSGKNPDAELLASQKTSQGTYALFLEPTGQAVKRAAPGGEGRVLDHFNPAAVRQYFLAMDGLTPPRCFFNDSWEVFGANATPALLTEFSDRHGYDLTQYLRELAGDGDPKTVARVRSDYRELANNWTSAFLRDFGQWARGQGAKMRNQAHGSPGNLLDLYAQADIPETEVFGPHRRNSPAELGPSEEALLCRFASSASHVTGKPFTSSESFTWLGEHAHVSLADMKRQVDRLLCLGINHIFFHGTPYSPADVPWPGWLFYASTHCAPTNPFWSDLPTLNGYIARCQSVLQEGLPDSDALLYFPFHDLIASEKGAHDGLQFMTVGRTETYLRGNLSGFVDLARRLVSEGRTFDLVSDQQLVETVAVAPDGALTVPGGARYREIILPPCECLPVETMERLADLAEAGVPIVTTGVLPTDVPGLSNREKRLTRLRTARERLSSRISAAHSVRRETVAEAGLLFIRRRIPAESGDEFVYFFANTSEKDVDATVPLLRAGAEKTATLYDPLTDRTGTTELTSDGLRLQIPIGSTLIVRLSAKTPGSARWRYHLADAEAKWQLLMDGWEVEFIRGGPRLPTARSLRGLKDWTTWEGSSDDETNALRTFSGTARYGCAFDRPSLAAENYVLDLGNVLHSARVRLNGYDLGTLIAPPYRVSVPSSLLRETGNVLEVEVTNLMANRLAELERQEGEKWRPFLMVNIQYKPFDAATWLSAPSGLLGPVRIGRAA